MGCTETSQGPDQLARRGEVREPGLWYRWSCQLLREVRKPETCEGHWGNEQAAGGSQHPPSHPPPLRSKARPGIGFEEQERLEEQDGDRTLISSPGFSHRWTTWTGCVLEDEGKWGKDTLRITACDAVKIQRWFVPDNIGFSSYSSLIELLLETTKGYELICEWPYQY